MIDSTTGCSIDDLRLCDRLHQTMPDVMPWAVDATAMTKRAARE